MNCVLLDAYWDSAEEAHFEQNKLMIKDPEIGVDFAVYGR